MAVCKPLGAVALSMLLLAAAAPAHAANRKLLQGANLQCVQLGAFFICCEGPPGEGINENCIVIPPGVTPPGPVVPTFGEFVQEIDIEPEQDATAVATQENIGNPVQIVDIDNDVTQAVSQSNNAGVTFEGDVKLIRDLAVVAGGEQTNVAYQTLDNDVVVSQINEVTANQENEAENEIGDIVAAIANTFSSETTVTPPANGGGRRR